jgi:hypothetical protein
MSKFTWPLRVGFEGFSTSSYGEPIVRSPMIPTLGEGDGDGLGLGLGDGLGVGDGDGDGEATGDGEGLATAAG